MFHLFFFQGAYRDDEGKPVVLQCVRNAEAKIAGCEFMRVLISGCSLFELNLSSSSSFLTSKYYNLV